MRFWVENERDIFSLTISTNNTHGHHISESIKYSLVIEPGSTTTFGISNSFFIGILGTCGCIPGVPTIECVYFSSLKHCGSLKGKKITSGIAYEINRDPDLVLKPTTTRV